MKSNVIKKWMLIILIICCTVVVSTAAYAEDSTDTVRITLVGKELQKTNGLTLTFQIDNLQLIRFAPSRPVFQAGGAKQLIS